MLKSFVIGILIFCISTEVFAQESIFLQKSTQAPFEGYLVPKDKILEFKKMSDELQNDTTTIQLMSKSIELYKDNENIYTKKISLLTDENDKLSKTINEEKSVNDFQKFLYVASGILVTVLVMIALPHALSLAK